MPTRRRPTPNRLHDFSCISQNHKGDAIAFFQKELGFGFHAAVGVVQRSLAWISGDWRPTKDPAEAARKVEKITAKWAKDVWAVIKRGLDLSTMAAGDADTTVRRMADDGLTAGLLAAWEEVVGRASGYYIENLVPLFMQHCIGRDAASRAGYTKLWNVWLTEYLPNEKKQTPQDRIDQAIWELMPVFIAGKPDGRGKPKTTSDKAARKLASLFARIECRHPDGLLLTGADVERRWTQLSEQAKAGRGQGPRFRRRSQTSKKPRAKPG